MATQTLRKHVWLINTIHNHPGISFREINNKWQYSDLSEGNELPLRTSHKWRNAIRKVLNEKEDSRETIIDYSIKIDEEIIKKRKEFGMPVD